MAYAYSRMDGLPTQRFLIDTDTASDDAVALVLALREPSITVEVITVVAGNVPLDNAVQNALYTRDLCRSAVPVFAGRAAPLVRPLVTAQFVHGEDGMGDIGLPLHGRAPAAGDAVEVMIETIVGTPREMTLVALGPLTNVAAALAIEPRIAQLVRHCFVMGGAGSGTGNITATAEYNFWADPEAARVVVRSAMPITMVGWDMSVRFAAFGPAEAKELAEVGPLGRFCVDIQAKVDVYAREQSGLAGFDLPDPIAMAVAIEPDIARFEEHHLDVLVGTDRGRDEIDWSDQSGSDQKARITTDVDRTAFLAMLHKACLNGSA
ncbi:MAG: nucleoside hydrolase [Acidimicrobiia bacterium]|nr:nucleoside hydrolase [Acidimicrobiia bacterium]MDQ3501458.1 nucleoside hydrolase [Actinomycetota bacterium]